MLDDLDRELEKRGHRFVRYADDIRVYMRTKRAAERTLASVTDFLERRLRLKVNREKSAAKHAAKSAVLGFAFYFTQHGPALRIDPKALACLRYEIRKLTRRARGISMDKRIGLLNWLITGWCAYFAIAETPGTFRTLDEWLRRRLRQARWKEWKRVRTRIRNLRALGIPHQKAYEWGNTRKRPWRIAGSPPLARALPSAYWESQGLKGFVASHSRLRRA